MFCLLGIFAANAQTEVLDPDEGTPTGIFYKLESGTLTISGMVDMPDMNYRLWPWDSDRGSITTIIIQNGVSAIGSEAFASCANLTSVTIPESVTSIHSYSFIQSTKLASITIPKFVTTVGQNAFGYCSGLTEITVMNPTPPTIGKQEGITLSNVTLNVPEGSESLYSLVDVWKDFGPDDSAISITSRTPGIDATNVATDVRILVEFSDDITASNLSLITLKDGNGTSAGNVVGTIVGKVLTIAHDDFEYNTKYTVTIPTGALTGYSTAITWSFTTKKNPTDGYYSADYNWLKNYVTTNNTKFGIGSGLDYADYEEWFEAHAKDNETGNATKPLIYWNQDAEKRIKDILWQEKNLEGTLDVSGLTKLKQLICQENQIEELKLPTSLTVLYCWKNKLQTLNVAPLTDLTQLDCGNNQLKVLEVSGLTKLTALSCANNQLKVLDVAELTELANFTCQKNELKKLEVTKLTKLFLFSCWGNELTTLDVAPLVNLEYFYCSDNKLTELTVKSTKLIEFQCHRNQIPFSKLPKVNVAGDINDYVTQTITHPVSVLPNNTIDLTTMTLPDQDTKVKYNGTEIATLTFDDPNFTIPSDWLGKIELKMTNTYFPQSEEEDKYNVTYILNVTTASSTYHTVTLEIAPGIDLLNLQPGNLQIQEGGHLQLQFLPENTTATADNILFLVDGIETSIKDFGGNNYYSYILSPINADHTILIALKEYTVTLPEVEGVTFDVGSGDHAVGYGEKFTFTLTVADSIDPADVHVYANGTEVMPEALRATTLTYIIDKVIGPITVTIDGAGEPTGNTGIAESKVSIAVESGKLTIESAGQAVDVAVYTVQGKNVASLRALRGSETISLAAGIYIVKAGNEVRKIVIP